MAGYMISWDARAHGATLGNADEGSAQLLVGV
jgi:hypothetical protein